MNALLVIVKKCRDNPPQVQKGLWSQPNLDIVIEVRQREANTLFLTPQTVLTNLSDGNSSVPRSLSLKLLDSFLEEAELVRR